MGVEYFPCDQCKGTICDVGPFEQCYECDDYICVDCLENLDHITVCERCKHVWRSCDITDCECECSRSMIIVLCTKCSSPRKPTKEQLLSFLMEKAGFETRLDAETACMNHMGIDPVYTIIKRKGRARYEIIQINPASPIASLSSSLSEKEDEPPEKEDEILYEEYQV